MQHQWWFKFETGIYGNVLRGAYGNFFAQNMAYFLLK